MSCRKPLPLLAVLLALAWPATGGAEEGRLVVRARVEPDSGVVVGQRVDFYVEVLTDTWFAGGVDIPDFDLEGAIALRPERFGANLNERIEGTSFSGRRFRWAVYPQRPGPFVVPPLEVTVPVARPGTIGGDPRTMRTEAQRFDASVPAGASGVGSFVTTSRFQVTQRLDRSREGLRVGDSLTRSVSMTAEDAPGMLLPPLPSKEIDGLGVYLDPPRVSEEIYRGAITGTRVESVTYLMEREGEFQLPSVDLYWWDLDAGRLRKETLPAIELAVAHNPELDTAQLDLLMTDDEPPGGSPEARVTVQDVAVATIAIAVLSFAAFAIRRGAPRIASAWRERRRRRDESETAWFARFRRAARSGDATAAMRQLFFWLDRADPGPNAATLRRFLCQADDGELTEQVATLESRLFTREGDAEAETAWSGQLLTRRVATARRRLRRSRTTQARRTRLPPLNPDKEEP